MLPEPVTTVAVRRTNHDDVLVEDMPGFVGWGQRENPLKVCLTKQTVVELCVSLPVPAIVVQLRQLHAYKCALHGIGPKVPTDQPVMVLRAGSMGTKDP